MAWGRGIAGNVNGSGGGAAVKDFFFLVKYFTEGFFLARTN